MEVARVKSAVRLSAPFMPVVGRTCREITAGKPASRERDTTNTTGVINFNILKLKLRIETPTCT